MLLFSNVSLKKHLINIAIASLLITSMMARAGNRSGITQGNSFTARIESPRDSQHFGRNLSAHGKWLFVGALKGLKTKYLGFVSVYRKTGNEWNRVQVLRKASASLTDSLVVSANTAFVEGWENDAKGKSFHGVLFVYTNKNGHWNETASISPIKEGEMAYNGRELFVGDEHQNGIRIYAKKKGIWQQVGQVHGKNGFATKFAVSKSRLIALSYGKGGWSKGHGKVTIFGRIRNRWLRSGEIVPSRHLANYHFRSVALSSNGDDIFIAVSKHPAPVTMTSPGAERILKKKGISRAEKEKLLWKYSIREHELQHDKIHSQVLVYRKRGEYWKIIDQAFPKNPSLSDGFGRNMWFFNDQVFISAPRASIISNGCWCGAVYVFKQQAGKWRQTLELHGKDPDDPQTFGKSVAVAGNLLFVGAPWALVRGVELGAVYEFTLGNKDQAPQ